MIRPQPLQIRKYEHDSYLEKERANFLQICSAFIDDALIDSPRAEGRPKFSMNDLFKALLIQCFNGLSYRRVQSDLYLAKALGILTSIPKRSTLNKYMSDKSVRAELERLIQISAFPFLNSEDKLIVDSTWFTTKMYSGGHNKKPTNRGNKQANIPPMAMCRKLHIGILTNSKIIAYATTTAGTANDNPLFKQIVSTICNNGFMIDKCLADAGYLSKANYALCQYLGIKDVFIDFKSNITGKHPKSKAWASAFHLYKHENDIWHEDYRFRVLIESVWSVMKRKFINWLRTQNTIAQDNEMLLKALCYNLTILARYY